MSILPFHRLRPALSVVVAATLLSACSLNRDEDPTVNWTAEQLYADAVGDLSAGNWSSAVKGYQKLESRYPFGRYAQQAQLDMAYARYRDGDRAEALAAVERFLRLHPTHIRFDYALYLKGLIQYTTRLSPIARLAGEDLSNRDLQSARDSFDTFRQLVGRFPSSPYSVDARRRMAVLVERMARGELDIARYYLRRGALVAAVSRAQGVLQQFPDSPSTGEALQVMVDGYDRLGLDQLRDDTRRILQRTVPQGAPG